VAKAGPAIPPLLISFALMIAALILLTLRRWQRTFALIPLPTLLEEYTPHALATKFWNQSRKHLSLLSIRIDPEETISDFAKRVGNIPVSISGCGQDTYHFQLTQIAFLYERWIFGRIPPTDEELILAYDECSATITKVKKAHTSLFYYVLHYLVRAQ